MLYYVCICDGELGEHDEQYLVEGKDSLKEIKRFLVSRGYLDSSIQVEKVKPLTIDQFKNKVNKK